MSAEYKIENSTLTLKIDGRFTFDVYHELSEATRAAKYVNMVVVDLSKVTYLDSSALGMLLVLKDSCSKVILKRPKTEEVSRILQIANFDKLFKIE